jgi:TRAP-type C4-dicarboxylate transport system permease small subunit
MLHTLFDRTTRGIELVLAVAFIAAVCMSFANVLGRYLFGVTFGWIDEVQVFIMIWMAFLGAVVVSWRGAHLRMDLIAKALPRPVQVSLRFAEIVVLVAAAGLVVAHSYRYTANMLVLGRVSDVGGIPMWIPHGGVVIGFAMIAVIALAQLWDLARGTEAAP